MQTGPKWIAPTFPTLARPCPERGVSVLNTGKRDGVLPVFPGDSPLAGVTTGCFLHMEWSTAPFGAQISLPLL